MDEDGTHLVAGSKAITVHNVEPQVTQLTLQPSIPRKEEPFSLTIAFADPGTPDIHEITIDWDLDDPNNPLETPPVPLGNRSVTLSHTYLADLTYRTEIKVRDDDLGEDVEQLDIVVKSAEVVDRHIFYNNSYYDGNDPAANTDDFDAIAPHTSVTGGHGPHPSGFDEPGKELGKDALLPGEMATFANYTGYEKGINGIMIDVVGLGDPISLNAADDFVFRVGNDNDPSGWTQLVGADLPSVTVFAGAGTPDDESRPSDRVTLIWPDNTIEKQWLQVTVLTTENTGLAEADVFYWGNAIGETGEGNTSLYAFVTVSDELGARHHPHNFLNRAATYDPYDHNKDSFVTISDELIARHNATNFLDALKLIAVPGTTGFEFDDSSSSLVAEQDAEDISPSIDQESSTDGAILDLTTRGLSTDSGPAMEAPTVTDPGMAGLEQLPLVSFTGAVQEEWVEAPVLVGVEPELATPAVLPPGCSVVSCSSSTPGTIAGTSGEIGEAQNRLHGLDAWAFIATEYGYHRAREIHARDQIFTLSRRMPALDVDLLAPWNPGDQPEERLTARSSDPDSLFLRSRHNSGTIWRAMRDQTSAYDALFEGFAREESNSLETPFDEPAGLDEFAWIGTENQVSEEKRSAEKTVYDEFMAFWV